MYVFNNSKFGKSLIGIIIILVTILLFLTYSIGKIDGRNEYKGTLSDSVTISSVSEMEQEIEKKNIIIMNLVKQNNKLDEIINDLFILLGHDPNQ